MLTDYITRGGQAGPEDMGVDFTSGMPGFGAVLEQDKIETILNYIKTTWPEPVRRVQAERSEGVPVD